MIPLAGALRRGASPIKEASDYTQRSALERLVPAPLLAFFGFGIAALGALCGIGGGLFTTPLAHFGFRFPLRRAVPVSLALVATTTISATVTETLHADTSIYWGLVGLLAICALCGNQIGFALVSRIPVRTMKAVFAVVMLVVGVKIILGSGNHVVSGEATLALADYINVGLLGVFAGILVPLLGIGGGLVMVPGLLFLVPQIGYLGTRGTSMAVAAIIASRSLAKFARRGELDTRTGLWLAVGALIGAFVGVQWVHVPGVSASAQLLMGIILVVSSLRFAWDVRSSKSTD